GVDVGAKAEIHRLVRGLAERGCGVVLISSELPEVQEHSDRIAVFRSGSVVGTFESGTATAVELAEAALPHEAPDAAELARRRGRRLARASILWNEFGLLAGLAALSLALAGTTSGRFLTFENLSAVVVNTSVLMILALGAASVIVAGGIDISVGSLLGLA